MKLENELKLDYDDVLIKPQKSTLNSRKEVDLVKTFNFKHTKTQWTGVPVVAANMHGIGTFAMAKALSEERMLTALVKYYSADKYKGVDLAYSFVTTGIKDEDLKKLKTIIELTGANKICIDAANGYTERFMQAVKKVRQTYPQAVIMAGNVVTPDMAVEIIEAGADIVKLGIGPGSVCTTRKMAGVGYPQFSAVMECAQAVHKIGGLVCADGGCKSPGDIAKAFGAGADFVMNGGLFAGHDESEDRVVVSDGKKYIEFYGSSSKEALQKYGNGHGNYRAAEGKCVLIPYRGPVQNTLVNISGGLRSACTYVGAKNLNEFPDKVEFIRVNQQLNNVFNSYEKPSF